MSQLPNEQYDVAAIMGGLYGDGIIGCQGAFPRAFIAQLGRDIDALFAEARSRPGGALERGPNRYYVEIHPERLSGFAAIASHPWVAAVCSAVLGPDYNIVEAGFDIAGPGAMRQRKLPHMGDISARSALTIHRGTANVSQQARPVFVLGVDAPDARNAERHDLQLTRACFDSLPAALRGHLRCRVVDTLQPLVQAHTIQGLRMGAKG